MEIEFRDGKVFKIYCKEGTVGIPQIVPAKESQVPEYGGAITEVDLARAWDKVMDKQEGYLSAEFSTVFKEYIKELGL